MLSSGVPGGGAGRAVGFGYRVAVAALGVVTVPDRFEDCRHLVGLRMSPIHYTRAV